MILLGIFFSLFGIGFMCWLIFNAAVYVLPFYVGGWAAIGAGIAGLAVGVVTVIAGQLAILAIPVTAIRAGIALLFAVPAAVAGYSATLGLAEIGIPSYAWGVAFGVIGAAMVGGTAWARMTFAAPTLVGQALAGGSD
jgi:hypothetical protein